MTVSALLFDCDGLLVDSESSWLRMVSGWLDDHGLRLPAAEFTGLTAADAAARLAEPAQREAAAIDAELSERYTLMLADGVPARPGASELLALVTGHVPLAVASNGLRADVETCLEATGLAPVFHAIVTAEDVAAGKPDPELYRKAAERLGVDPASCLVFEDSPVGCLAGRRAGARVIGVNDSDVRLDCDVRLRTLRDVTPALLHDLGLHLPAATGTKGSL